MAERLFVFVQMEFPWMLGPADGRYLLRESPEAEPERVIVLGTHGAARREHRRDPDGRLRSALRRIEPGRGQRPATPEPAPVSTTRVTLIDPISLSAEHQAQAWLEELDHDVEVTAAVATVNRVLFLQRIASADPHVHEVSRDQALVVRAGWGEGEQVANGNWLHARELPAGGGRRGGRRRRSEALRPQERLAVLLGGRSRALLCEELALRARLDLDAGRLDHAAVELDGALAAAVPELRAEDRHDLLIRIAELEQLRDGITAQAAAAFANDEGTPREEETIAHVLERLESALRARTATGFAR